jgi:molecular chaperone DnaK
VDAAEIKKAHDELAQEAHKLAEAMYAKASQSQPGQSAPPGGEGAAAGKKEKAEDVVDADFEEVKGDTA